VSVTVAPPSSRRSPRSTELKPSRIGNDAGRDRAQLQVLTGGDQQDLGISGSDGVLRPVLLRGDDGPAKARPARATGPGDPKSGICSVSSNSPSPVRHRASRSPRGGSHAARTLRYCQAPDSSTTGTSRPGAAAGHRAARSGHARSTASGCTTRSTAGERASRRLHGGLTIEVTFGACSPTWPRPEVVAIEEHGQPEHRSRRPRRVRTPPTTSRPPPALKIGATSSASATARRRSSGSGIRTSSKARLRLLVHQAGGAEEFWST